MGDLMLNSSRISSHFSRPERHQAQVRQQSGVHEDGVCEANLAEGLNAHVPRNVYERKKS
jgi:hypothetical protein